ncbi:unnamed protein product, partial [Staurois parvus]
MHWWAALGGQHWGGGHRWVALVGTGGWHWWAQVGGHRWVALLGTCRWHCRVAQVGALLGTGGGTAGHRWGHCWERVGGASGRTAGRKLRVSLLGTDHQGT